MKCFVIYFLLAALFFTGCQSAPPPEYMTPTAEEPEPVQSQSVPAEPAPAEADPVPEEPPVSFDVSQELYDNTLTEVQNFIVSLNKLISAKNFSKWKDALSDEFFKTISSPEFLANTSQSAALKSRKIVLKTPNDYFTHVVVPSRSNSRVDEIEFVAEDRVKVFYLETRTKKDDNNEATIETRRLRLYELIKAGDTWKIID